MKPTDFVSALRGCAPYVHAHNGSVFVVAFGGEVAARPDFDAFIYDLALLHSLGVKLVLEALHSNELPFINGGEHVDWVPQVPIWLSLAVILGVLAVTTAASLLKVRHDPSAAEDPDGH